MSIEKKLFWKSIFETAKAFRKPVGNYIRASH